MEKDYGLNGQREVAKSDFIRFDSSVVALPPAYPDEKPTLTHSIQTLPYFPPIDL